MAGIAKLEVDPFFQGKYFIILKAPGKFIDGFFKALNLFVTFIRKREGIVQHGNQKRFCGVSADYLALESSINQIRHPSDMINMRMGKKQIINIPW